MTLSKANVERIIMVEEYLITHLEERIKIEDLIVRFHLSDSAITKGFKTLYGTTIHRYHLQKSMELALIELQKGGDIKALALRFGYTHPWSFTRAFKSIHKVSPLTYKQALLLPPDISTL